MDTSGGSVLGVVLTIVVLALFVGATARPIWRSAVRRPWTAIVAVVVIGIPSLGQFAWPQLGAALMRDPEATLQHGQWWRVLTALLAQDGGLAAAVFNLVVVALVMLAGDAVWGWWRAALLFVGCSAVLNLAALGWGPGGGTSFASDGLLMAVSARLALEGGALQRWAAALQLAAAVVLIAAGDAHGVALALGFALGAALTALSTRPAGAMPSA
ncbi:MAG: hypothetical protein BGO95_05835 [Micrococcales bacterium 73-13]|nr:MAG: hypothetical protein BGO95_05835 [Micrococcales bacterium 73-13]